MQANECRRVCVCVTACVYRDLIKEEQKKKKRHAELLARFWLRWSFSCKKKKKRRRKRNGEDCKDYKTRGLKYMQLINEHDSLKKTATTTTHKKKEVQFKGLEKLQTEKKRKEKHSTSFPASTQYLYS